MAACPSPWLRPCVYMPKHFVCHIDMHPRRAEAARTGMHAGSHRAVCARVRVRGAHGAARGTGGGRGDAALRLACQSPDWTPKHHCCCCMGSGGSDVAAERPDSGAGCSGWNPPATWNTSSGCRRTVGCRVTSRPTLWPRRPRGSYSRTHRSSPALSLVPPPGERKGAGWPAGRKAGTALSWRTASRRAGVVRHHRGGDGRPSAPDEPLGMLGTVPSPYQSTSHR